MIPVDDDASLALVREAVRDTAATIAMDEVGRESCAIVASELCRNQLKYARYGDFAVYPVEHYGVAGLELLAVDKGPGIANVGAALNGGVFPQDSLKQGLPGARRLADEVDIDVRAGECTRIYARKFVQRPPWLTEMGIFGRPFPGEHRSGDDATYVKSALGRTFAVADGLGHGPDARLASRRVIQSIQSCADPLSVIRAGDTAMGVDTRGAALSVVTIKDTSATLSFAGVGNVAAEVHSSDRVHRFHPAAGTLGTGRLPRRLVEETMTVPEAFLLVLSSDGVARLQATALMAYTRHHPAAIAQQLVESLGSPSDDATLLVVKRSKTV